MGCQCISSRGNNIKILPQCDKGVGWAGVENFKRFEPALRSVLLGVMRTKTKDELESQEGKEKLKFEMLKAINEELKNLGAKPEIKTVQFTRILII